MTTRKAASPASPRRIPEQIRCPAVVRGASGPGQTGTRRAGGRWLISARPVASGGRQAALQLSGLVTPSAPAAALISANAAASKLTQSSQPQGRRHADPTHIAESGRLASESAMRVAANPADHLAMGVNCDGRKWSRWLACRDRLPCGSVVTGEFGLGRRDWGSRVSIGTRSRRTAWTGLNSLEPVGAGSLELMLGTPNTRLSTLPIKMPRPVPATTSNGKCAPRYTRDRQTAAASAQGRTFHQPFR